LALVSPAQLQDLQQPTGKLKKLKFSRIYPSLKNGDFKWADAFVYELLFNKDNGFGPLTLFVRSASFSNVGVKIWPKRSQQFEKLGTRMWHFSFFRAAPTSPSVHYQEQLKQVLKPATIDGTKYGCKGRRASLYRHITLSLLTSPLATRLRLPHHLIIKPDR
jgi:hypothetical protein